MAANTVTATACAMALTVALAAPQAAAWERDLGAGATVPSKWAYAGDNGPAHWGQLTPEFSVCSTGKLQSPVPLMTADAISLPCEPLRFRYRSSSLYITNDGKSLRLGYDRGSYVVIDGLSYELAELRFHVPAEHVIEGHVADAELQLIHGNNRGDIAVVAVPILASRRVNQIFRRIVEHAPVVPGETYYGRNVGFNPLFLLPGRKDYFAYVGSLTIPPCSEGVHWYVMQTPVEVDGDDLMHLAQLMGPNARPLQQLDGRRVANVCGEP